MTLSSRWTTCIRLRGALRWRVFSLLASLAYCISSICSKAVFNVRRDTAAGSPAVPSRWWTISLASAMRSFAIWSCPHGWIDLLTSRALEREARSYERRARSASERKLSCRVVPHQTRKACERLLVDQQALQPESYLDTARRCYRWRVIAVSVKNQFDRQWGRNLVGP